MSKRAFKIRLAKNAAKQLEGLPANLRSRVIAALRAIENEPTCGVKLLGALAGSRRYRVGNYRIVYQINEPESIVYIENIRHRKSAYKKP